MYGVPGSGHGGVVVHSFQSIIDVIKCCEVERPCSRHAFHLGGSEHRVKLLANGFVELDWEVKALAIEREMERIMQQHGAVLMEIGCS